MRAHLIQLDIAWEAKQANYDKVERLVASIDAQPGDLILLPEMFDTGFSFNLKKTADYEGGTQRYLAQLASDLGVYVQGARTVHTPGAPHAHNRASIFNPQGKLIADFSKIHPFSLGMEQERFEGGDEVLTYQWTGPGEDPPSLTVCPAICYDLRFPELFRRGLLKGAEVFALGANWPEARVHHWRALLIARAIENQAFVLGVNRTGRDPNLAYIGGSIAVGPRGEILGELGPEEAALSVEINPAELHAWRGKFPAWRDIKLMS
jgi:omega-amidase